MYHKGEKAKWRDHQAEDAKPKTKTLNVKTLRCKVENVKRYNVKS